MSSARARSRGVPQPVPGDEATAHAEAEHTTCAGAGMPLTARVLFAVVSADGLLVRGLGAAAANRLRTGMYQVVFDQDVTGASLVGTVGLPGSSGLAPAGQIAVAGRTGIPNAVFVTTFDGAGSAADRPFHLAVLS
ncbi:MULTISPECIES: hypothetical protein [unclassified Micromonospora]|uniref:hypothetical protein n=1 Tax=unclassified Micromonospora TaxID=2617518 RepID=UPI0022B71D93|nr:MULTISPECIES: hypothetical protein [unclassified Micromonospora]MCZ7420656.1 hypothetical protein [Verrucosispora sp. WMMA2121]WBB88891.1 hypothetical protein O7597_17760 [Verrucosispora sp. WMMC514]